MKDLSKIKSSAAGLSQIKNSRLPQTIYDALEKTYFDVKKIQDFSEHF